MTNQNTLYLCGYEYAYSADNPMILVGLVDIIICVVSAYTPSHARSLLCSRGRKSLPEFVHPVTIRKVGATDMATGVYEDDKLERLAFQIVVDFEVPDTYTSSRDFMINYLQPAKEYFGEFANEG